MSTGRQGDEAEADRAVALSALALTGERRDACPGPGDIVSWHEQRLEAERAGAVEAHVAQCDRCFELWRGLLALAATDPRRRPVAASLGARLWTALAAAARNRAALGALTAGVAAIAIVGVYLALQVQGGLGAPLPGYELQLQGRALYRGAQPAAGAERVAFEAGTRFELVLRPDSAVSDEVAARVWVEHDGATRELAAPPTLVARGVVVISGHIGSDWALPAGDSDLLVAVGRAQALPDAATLARELGDEGRHATGDWVAWRVPVRVGD